MDKLDVEGNKALELFSRNHPDNHTIPEFIKSRVHEYYWDKDINCTGVTLKNLAEYFNLSLDCQVLDSALGMHGAGGYRAQCGLVEGSLLFIGIYGRHKKLQDKDTVELCRLFAEQFEARFSSLQCRTLRPEGFAPENPPHLCEQLTCTANEFAINFVRANIGSVWPEP